MRDKYKEVIDDPESPVLDINESAGEVMSILLLTDGGTELIDGSAENTLLYVHGLREVLEGEQGAKLSEDPYVSVEKTAARSVYRIAVGDRPVESMPHQADDVLEALQAAVEDSNLDPLLDIYEEIIDSQVRRGVVNDLKELLPNIDSDRIEVTDRGWLIDGFYVVDWTASVYVVTDDPNEDDYVIQTSGVGRTERDHEFVELVPSESPERKKVTMPDGESVIVGEREMMFLSKVEWLLNRTSYHPDESFWRYNEQLRKDYLRNDS